MANPILLETTGARAENLGDSITLLTFSGDMSSNIAQWLTNALVQLRTTTTAFVLEGTCSYDQNEIDELIQREDWSALQTLSADFQALAQTIRELDRPIVAALSGDVSLLSLELALSCDSVVETNAVYAFPLAQTGFTPTAGGLSELALSTYAIGANVPGCDIIPFFKRIFQQLTMGKPCAGFAEALAKGITLPNPSVTDVETLLAQAKAKALFISTQGYSPSSGKRNVVASGTTGRAALEIVAINMFDGKFLPPALFAMAKDIARTFGGGDVPKGTLVDEDRLRQVETESFINSCKAQVKKEVSA